MDESKGCTSGWQNYLRKAYIQTNNSIEGYNKTLKDVSRECAQKVAKKT